ncbi:MAG: hypothetical protein K8R45_06255 [Desulfobacterales bacterium]|nr:hypothetical protein [Desulfobacterales bacterium]
MISETFIIKSLVVQNMIMLFSLGIVVSLLVRSFVKKKTKHAIVFSVWVLIVFWFFNSPFFGFSVVYISPDGIQLTYGILSFKKNTVLPLDAPWKIETTFSGIRKIKKLYFLKIADHRSMKVRGVKDFRLLQAIGSAVDNMKSK